MNRISKIIIAIAVIGMFASCGDNSEPYNTGSGTAEGDYTFKASIAAAGDIGITSGSGDVDVIGAPLEGEEVTVTLGASAGEDNDPPTPPEPEPTPSKEYGLSGSGGFGCTLIR